MNVCRYAAWLAPFVLLFGTRQASASQLLGSLQGNPNGQAAPFSASGGLQLVIDCLDSDYRALASLGRGHFWQDGASGFLQLDASNDGAFNAMAGYLTDGVDQFLILSEYDAQGGGHGAGGLESLWGLGAPDLRGFRIDFARLTVHDLTITPYTDPVNGDGLMWDGHITWEFWGEPVPEPAAISLLSATCLIAGAVKRRGRE